MGVRIHRRVDRVGDIEDALDPQQRITVAVEQHRQPDAEACPIDWLVEAERQSADIVGVAVIIVGRMASTAQAIRALPVRHAITVGTDRPDTPVARRRERALIKWPRAVAINAIGFQACRSSPLLTATDGRDRRAGASLPAKHPRSTCRICSSASQFSCLERPSVAVPAGPERLAITANRFGCIADVPRQEQPPVFRGRNERVARCSALHAGPLGRDVGLEWRADFAIQPPD